MEDDTLLVGAPDTAIRQALVAHLRAAGYDEQLLHQAAQHGRLYALEGDQLVRPGAVLLTIDGVASRLGQDPAATEKLWRALGLTEPVADEPVATEEEADALGVWPIVAQIVGEHQALALARVHASAVARMGEAVAATLVEALPDVDLLHSSDELATSRAFAAAASLMPQVVRSVEMMYRHHLLAATRHFEQAQAPTGFGPWGVPWCVAFADLCGFTAATERLDSVTLHTLLGVFESVAHDEAAAAGVRCVKLIGDAAMLVGASPDALARAAHGVIVRLAELEEALPVRVGMAAGDVIVRAGDYFGPAVNLAARLLELALPGEVLAESVLASRLGASWDVEAREPQQVKGIAEPVVPYVIQGVVCDPGCSVESGR
ncbi:MAG: adenylate/guanylate cyclase domain-containing protein [Mycobacteriales bacterium]|nr:adenylate/guanylate cyclase domain-containing protein [Mycobacteriales bacterium]